MTASNFDGRFCDQAFEGSAGSASNTWRNFSGSSALLGATAAAERGIATGTFGVFGREKVPSGSPLQCSPAPACGRRVHQAKPEVNATPIGLLYIFPKNTT